MPLLFAALPRKLILSLSTHTSGNDEWKQNINRLAFLFLPSLPNQMFWSMPWYPNFACQDFWPLACVAHSAFQMFCLLDMYIGIHDIYKQLQLQKVSHHSVWRRRGGAYCWRATATSNLSAPGCIFWLPASAAPNLQAISHPALWKRPFHLRNSPQDWISLPATSASDTYMPVYPLIPKASGRPNCVMAPLAWKS